MASSLPWRYNHIFLCETLQMNIDFLTFVSYVCHKKLHIVCIGVCFLINVSEHRHNIGTNIRTIHDLFTLEYPYVYGHVGT